MLTKLQTFRSIQELRHSLSLNPKVDFVDVHSRCHNFLYNEKMQRQSSLLLVC